MCEEFNLTKWTKELVKRKLKYQYGIKDDNQLNEIVDMVQDVMEGRHLYHSEKDFPKNAEELGKLWGVGYTHGLKVGDRVQFKYTMNIDPATTEQKRMLRCCQDEFATVTGFKKCNISDSGVYSELCKYILVDFDSEALNEIDIEFLPMQFIKVVRGLRAKSRNIIDEACNMNSEDIEEVLHKSDKPNKIDFESAIKKKKDNTDKKVQEFNSVINDNIDEIKKLFKSDYSEYIIRLSCDDKGYLKLIIKRTVFGADKLYEFGHIEERGDSHNIKEVTINRLKNFVSDIYVKNNLK